MLGQHRGRASKVSKRHKNPECDSVRDFYLLTFRDSLLHKVLIVFAQQRDKLLFIALILQELSHTKLLTATFNA